MTALIAVKINAEQLLFNWQLGRDLVTRKAEELWGAGVVEQLSLDLQNAFPESKGFSTTNLWRMKQWYLFYSNARTKLPQLVGEIQIREIKEQLPTIEQLKERLRLLEEEHWKKKKTTADAVAKLQGLETA